MARRQRSAGGSSPLNFVISVAAELAGMHPQTLRQYDRLGLVTPARTKGRGRRYSQKDVQKLRHIQRLSQEEGINLEGIRRILDLERQVELLQAEGQQLLRRVEAMEERKNRIFAASSTGEVRPLRRGQRSWTVGDAEAAELVVWRGLHPRSNPAPFMPRVRAAIEAPAAQQRNRPQSTVNGRDSSQTIIIDLS